MFGSVTMSFFNFSMLRFNYSKADCVEQMITHMPKKIDISPTLRDIVSRFNEANRRPSYLLDDQSVASQSSCHEKQPELEDDVFDDHASHSFDHEGPADVDETRTFMDQNFSGSYEPEDANDSCENVRPPGLTLLTFFLWLKHIIGCSNSLVLSCRKEPVM